MNVTTLGTSYKWNHTGFVFLWLVYFSISSGFIHVVVCVRIPILFKAEYYSIVWTFHILFIHSSFGRRLGCFHFFATVSNAEVSLCVHISVQDPSPTFFYILAGYNSLGKRCTSPLWAFLIIELVDFLLSSDTWNIFSASLSPNTWNALIGVQFSDIEHNFSLVFY